MSVRPPHGTARLPPDGFFNEIITKISQHIPVLIKM
jgi:hypothetical protein